MSEPRNMTTSPWDAQEFCQRGCFAQLVGGPANGEVVKFGKGERELVVLVNDPKPKFNDTPSVPAVVEKLFGKQPRRAIYRIQLLSFPGLEFAIGVWDQIKPSDAMLQLLADARALRAIYPEPTKYPKKTAQSISIEADLTEINTGLLAKLGGAPKQDTTDPKEDTGDGTFSTSA